MRIEDIDRNLKIETELPEKDIVWFDANEDMYVKYGVVSSDEEITLQIQENAYLQYFFSYEAYDDSKPPFDALSMVYFRKRLTPEILGDINEMILSMNKTEEHNDDNDGNNNSNSGTMIVHATCALSQIKYPRTQIF